jgi:hypothetical protein
MATPSDISVGLVHELTITATKVGWEPKDFADLAHSEEKLRRILPFVRGFAEITQVQHIVDCDAKPFLQNGWKVEEHKKGGQLMLDMSKVRLHLSPNQMDGKRIEGNKLRKELASESVLNANVLDYLLAHPDLIPEDWKKDERGNTRYIFFWGTIYRTGGSLYVRYLYWDGGAWIWDNDWLGSDWRGRRPSAVLAS